MSLEINQQDPALWPTEHRRRLLTCTEGWVAFIFITTCLVSLRLTIESQRRLGHPHPWGLDVPVGPTSHLLLASGRDTEAQGPSGLMRKNCAHHSRAQGIYFLLGLQTIMMEDWPGFLFFQVSWLGLGERKNDLEKALPV